MFGLFKKKNCDQLCVGNRNDTLLPIKTGIVHDLVNNAYGGAFDRYGNTLIALEEGRKEAKFITSNVRSVDGKSIIADAESRYAAMVD